MSKVLIVAEHSGVSLNHSTAKCISCAADLPNTEIHVVLFSASGAAMAAEAAALSSVDKVLQIDHPANKHAMAAIPAPQVADLAKGYSHIFGSSTTFGKDLMPRVAALLNVRSSA